MNEEENLRNKILQQYKEMGLDEALLFRVNKELRLNFNLRQLNSMAQEKRLQSVREAISWKKGKNQQNPIITEIYKLPEGYTIAVAKPGKEAAPDYKGCRYYKGERKNEKTNNPNDMQPLILKDDKKIGNDWTFEDMFERIIELSRIDEFGLELIGMLLFRAAFMIDHKEKTEGCWRYSPPKDIVKIVEERMFKVLDIPVTVFLYFLEVLSLNEDVKVYTLGYNKLREDYGRINTLLTFVHLIAVLLNRRSFSKFAGAFARPPAGMSPIPKTKITVYFPLFSPELSQEDLKF